MERYIEALGDMIDFLNSGWYELDDKIPDMYSELDMENDWNKMKREEKSHMKNREIWAMKKRLNGLNAFLIITFVKNQQKRRLKHEKDELALQ